MAHLNEIARRELPDHIEQVKKVALSQQWEIEHDSETGLTFVHMIGGKGVGLNDPFLLRLEFDFYPLKPPSALFVDLETRERGSVQQQKSFWPVFNKQTGPTQINIIEDNRVGGLYLCYPYTYEFEVTHNSSLYRWNSSTHSVLTTLITLQSAMSRKGYGRYSQ